MTRQRRVVIDRAAVLAMVGEGATNEQIAARFGVTVRTLTRHRRNDPLFNDAIKATREAYFEANRVPHGSPSRYSHGCRCDPCRAANTERGRQQRARRYTGEIPAHVAHGSAATYANWGCRCRPCTYANAVACERRRASRAAS